MRADNKVFVVSLGLVAAIVAGEAGAETQATMQVAIEKDAAKKDTCTVKKWQASLTRELIVESEQPLTGLKVKGTTAPLITRGSAKTWIVERPAGAEPIKGSLVLEYADANKASASVDCSERELFKAATPDKEPTPTAGTASSTLAKYDAEASRWWLSHGSKALLDLRYQLALLASAPGAGTDANPDVDLDDVHLFVHLPSGAKAPPFRARMSEGEAAQVVLIVPAGANITADVAVTGCEGVVPFRVRSNGTTPALGPKDAGTDARQPPSATDFELRPIGEQLRCGPDEFSYAIRTAVHDTAKTGNPAASEEKEDTETKDTQTEEAEAEPNAASTTITVGSRNHLAGVAIAGYSSARQVEFVKETDRSEADGTVTIAKKHERRGAGVYVGALWMVGGVDYGNMKWYNYFANVFVGVNPQSPLDDIVAGLSATLSGGISVSLGVNVLKGVRLDDYSVGDEFSGDGAIPTKPSWKEAHAGFFGGFAIDTDIYEALTAATE